MYYDLYVIERKYSFVGILLFCVILSVYFGYGNKCRNEKDPEPTTNDQGPRSKDQGPRTKDKGDEMRPVHFLTGSIL